VSRRDTGPKASIDGVYSVDARRRRLGIGSKKIRPPESIT
jgi:hypothetical protein